MWRTSQQTEANAAPIPLLRLLVEHLLAQRAVPAVLGHRLPIGAIHVVAVILPLRVINNKSMTGPMPASHAVCGREHRCRLQQKL
jgi:hypothetical protein